MSAETGQNSPKSKIAEFWDALFAAPGFQVSPALKRKLLIVAAGLVLLIACTMAFKLGRWSALNVDASSPAWELSLKARIILFKLKVAIGLVPAALALAYAAFQILDRSRLGARLMHWDPNQDTAESQGAKTLGAALLFIGLVLGLLLVVHGVLA